MNDKDMIKYRIKVIKEAKLALRQSAYNTVQLKSSATHTINLDEGALNALIRHYQSRLKR